jgi:hypothetical protein
MIVFNELEMIAEEAVMAYLKVLSFVCNLCNSTHTLKTIVLNNWMIVMNWKGCGRK